MTKKLAKAGGKEEFDSYIPPDATILSDGSVDVNDRDLVYRFTDDERHAMTFTGWGAPNLRFIEQRGPFQHGNTILGYRLERRVVQYSLRVMACSRDGYWDARGELIDSIRPNRWSTSGPLQLGRLRKRLPDGSLRDLDVMLFRGPAFAPRNLRQWDEWAFNETIRFVAPYPAIYDPVINEASWSLDDFGGLIFYESPDWDEHLTFPIAFGTDIIQGQQSITYAGTWPSYPTITITGPIESPTIENLTTGAKIALNYTIAAGQSLTISLDYGNKTIVDSGGINRIGTLTDDSNLGEFYIAPNPEAPGGVNAIAVSGDMGALGDTEVLLQYYTWYVSI